MIDKRPSTRSQLDEIRTYLQTRSSLPKIEWLGDVIVEDDLVVVFYRKSDDLQVIGLFVDLLELPHLDPKASIGAGVMDEIVEPSPHYRILDAPWGRGVTSSFDDVLWRGIGQGRYPNQTQFIPPHATDD